MNEHDVKIQNLKMQLDEKEFTYRMIKILFHQTPFYYLSWIVSAVGVVILISFIYAVENQLFFYYKKR